MLFLRFQQYSRRKTLALEHNEKRAMYKKNQSHKSFLKKIATSFRKHKAILNIAIKNIKKLGVTERI